MSALLAIATDVHLDGELVDEVARRRPDAVTIVLDREAQDAWALDDSPEARAIRDRLARLLSAVEASTGGAAVSAVVGDLRPLAGRRFDGVVDPALPLAALA